MKIATISDVHVKKPHGEADQLLYKFLTHPRVADSDLIFLLGDIFDLMCGPHQEYLQEFSHIFDRLDDLLKTGKKIYYCEGNHDVHLEKLFLKRWPGGELIPQYSSVVKEIDGRRYYFSHGDEHEIDNLSYQRYMRFIHLPPLKFIANYLLPYKVLNMLGQRASKASRKKGAKKFDAQKVQSRFRNGVSLTMGKGQYDFIIGGHSHVKDLFEIEGGGVYVNNGYALQTRNFIFIDNHEISFETLS